MQSSEVNISKKKILVIIPAYNEQECISNTIEKLKNDCPWASYIVVNDCSKDNTVNILDNNRYSYLSLGSNLGIGGAVQTGYKYALLENYDIAIQIDGDGQHDTAYLKDVIKPICDGECDIAIGSRFIDKKGFQSSFFRRLGINLLNSCIFITTGFSIKDCTSGFRAVNKEFIKLYASDYPIDYPEPEAIVMALMNGARIKEIPVVMKERSGGQSSIRPIHSLYYMIKVSLSIFICRIGNSKKRRK